MGSEQTISDDSVRGATGKGWADWLALLDGWDAVALGHKETARRLERDCGVGGWWAQTITVRHELERGLRVVGQRGRTFELSVTRTIRTTPERAFEALTDSRELSRWFTSKAEVDLRVGGRYSNADHDEGEYLLVDPPRRLRFTWENREHCPDTVVEVDIAATGEERTQVRLTHKKLPSAEGRADMKTGWSWAMDSLRSYLETGRPITFEAWQEARGG